MQAMHMPNGLNQKIWLDALQKMLQRICEHHRLQQEQMIPYSNLYFDIMMAKSMIWHDIGKEINRKSNFSNYIIIVFKVGWKPIIMLLDSWLFLFFLLCFLFRFIINVLSFLKVIIILCLHFRGLSSLFIYCSLASSTLSWYSGFCNTSIMCVLARVYQPNDLFMFHMV